MVINETCDNPGGGSPGDGTHLLRAMLDADLHDAAFGFVADPDVAAQAHRAGVGARLDVRLGGKHGDLHGPPIELACVVRTLTDGRIVLRHMLRGVLIDLGPSARLHCDGVDVIVTSEPFQTLDAEVFLLHGIDVTRCSVVGLKSERALPRRFRAPRGRHPHRRCARPDDQQGRGLRSPARAGPSGPASLMTDPAVGHSVDVAVIGGGMAGMSIAAELARSRTVAVLEREDDLGYHATSRSAAALLESYGSVEVRALTRASHRLLKAADTTTPLLTPRPLLWIADAAHADAVADLLAEQPDLRAISAADAASDVPSVAR